MDVIRRSASAIKSAPAGTNIEIGGHTDTTGGPASTLTLTQQRADSVKSALVSAEAPAATLTTKGFGG
jgi:OmpA-OmpF porin, OOP family